MLRSGGPVFRRMGNDRTTDSGRLRRRHRRQGASPIALESRRQACRPIDALRARPAQHRPRAGRTRPGTSLQKRNLVFRAAFCTTFGAALCHLIALGSAFRSALCRLVVHRCALPHFVMHRCAFRAAFPALFYASLRILRRTFRPGGRRGQN